MKHCYYTPILALNAGFVETNGQNFALELVVIICLTSSKMND